MTTIRLCTALSVLAAFGALTLQPAAALTVCERYVKTSLEQQQQNLKMKCGFAGAQWSVDKAAHASWCASVAPDVSLKAAKDRDQALKTCAPKKG